MTWKGLLRFSPVKLLGLGVLAGAGLVSFPVIGFHASCHSETCPLTLFLLTTSSAQDSGYKNEASASATKHMLLRCNFSIRIIILELSLLIVPQTKDVLHFSRATGKAASNNIMQFQLVTKYRCVGMVLALEKSDRNKSKRGRHHESAEKDSSDFPVG